MSTLSVAVSTVICLSLAAPNASAGEANAGRWYMGAGFGLGLVSGPAVLSDTSYEGRTGFVVGAYGRWMSPLSVIDVQLGYNFAQHGLTVEGSDVQIRRHSLSTSFNLHPLFLRILHNNWLWYSLAGWYLQSGLGVEFTGTKSDGLGLDDNDTAFELHIGSGIDIPLQDPNKGGGAFFIGFNWRWKFIFMEPGFAEHDDLDVHYLLFTVSYRINNISFFRVPRPQELKYR